MAEVVVEVVVEVVTAMAVDMEAIPMVMEEVGVSGE